MLRSICTTFSEFSDKPYDNVHVAIKTNESVLDYSSPKQSDFHAFYCGTAKYYTHTAAPILYREILIQQVYSQTSDGFTYLETKM